MKKLLINIAFASTLIACSTNQAPQSSPIVLENCSDARDLARSNHYKIKQAFDNNDAYTIGVLELENRAIVHSNPDCFPKLEQNIEHWKRMHDDM